MVGTVYVLGAGINRVPGHPDKEFEKPPLINDFFQLALSGSLLDSVRSSEKDTERFQNLLRYIERYWKFSEEDLRRKPFNLEECFTMLQLQRLEQEQGSQAGKELLKLESDLASLLAKYLVMFTEQSVYIRTLYEFGELIYNQKSPVLTFNYDLILERAIEHASGDTGNRPPSLLLKPHEEVPDEVLAQHEWSWTRALAYGVQFDQVQLQRAIKRPGLVEGIRFYNHHDNKLQEPPLLKLHGSLNWFRQTSLRADGTEPACPNEKEGDSVLLDRYPWLDFGMDPPEVDGWLLEPEIITPVLHKNTSSAFLTSIWSKARNELKDCRRLVIGGYSFPPADFHMRKLFLEAFENARLEELVIINPDTSVVKTARILCHFDRPVKVCANLEEYMSS